MSLADVNVSMEGLRVPRMRLGAAKRDVRSKDGLIESFLRRFAGFLESSALSARHEMAAPERNEERRAQAQPLRQKVGD